VASPSAYTFSTFVSRYSFTWWYPRSSVSIPAFSTSSRSAFDCLPGVLHLQQVGVRLPARRDHHLLRHDLHLLVVVDVPA
jgi:hypothetical protein